MSTRFLAAREDLETMRAEVERLSGRPTLVASTEYIHGPDRRYREPGGTEYRTLGKLELYLSGWDAGWPTGVYDREGNRVDNPHEKGGHPDRKEWVMRHELQVASCVHLVYPLLPAEEGNWLKLSRSSKEAFKPFDSVDLDIDLNLYGKVAHLSRGEEPPVALAPFVGTYEYPSRFDGEGPGIKFAVSKSIENPRERIDRWNERAEPFDAGSKSLGVCIRAPGWYNGYETRSIDYVNRFCLVDREPGRCVDCRGASGERRHLGLLVTSDSKSRADSLVCAGCFPRFAEQVGAILAAWQPPPMPEKSTKT